MRLYKQVDLVDGILVQFVGVYVTRWGKEDAPTVGFIEATKEEIEQAASEHSVWEAGG